MNAFRQLGMVTQPPPNRQTKGRYLGTYPCSVRAPGALCPAPSNYVSRTGLGSVTLDDPAGRDRTRNGFMKQDRQALCVLYLASVRRITFC